MAAIFPTIPCIVFTIIEPLSLVAGFVTPFLNPEWFIAEQIAFTPVTEVSLGATMVAYQLGNIYLLLAMVGLAVLYTTKEPKVARNYLIALWIADIGHVAITGYGMGYDQVVDIAKWNAMAWGNIGATAALFFVRSLYFLGAFGPDRVPLTVKWGTDSGEKKLQ